MFVLDEADEMLSRGFKDQIKDIFRKLRPNVQVDIRCSCNYCTTKMKENKRLLVTFHSKTVI